VQVLRVRGHHPARPEAGEGREAVVIYLISTAALAVYCLSIYFVCKGMNTIADRLDHADHEADEFVRSTLRFQRQVRDKLNINEKDPR
jgi:hypothetical protein